MAASNYSSSHVSPSNKQFIALENNPEVFTPLAHALGLPPSYSFHDVYSPSDPDALAAIPRPVHAIIVLIPDEQYNKVRAAEGTKLARHEDKLSYNESGPEERVMWFRQTIGNACGLYALLNAVANGVPREDLIPGSTFDRIFKRVVDLKPEARSRVVYESQELEDAHMAAARTGYTMAPPPEFHPNYHFEAFVRAPDGHLWELEGITDGPIDLGVMKHDEDVLSENAMERGMRRFFKVEGADPGFSIIALSKTL